MNHTALTIPEILQLHGYKSVEEGEVIDLHNTGVSNVEALSVFSNAKVGLAFSQGAKATLPWLLSDHFPSWEHNNKRLASSPLMSFFKEIGMFAVSTCRRSSILHGLFRERSFWHRIWQKLA